MEQNHDRLSVILHIRNSIPLSLLI